MKAVQHFSDEYLERCREMTPNDIVRFLDEFRRLHGQPRGRPGGPSKLISMKVPEGLLLAFKTRAQLMGVPYQTQIKKLMSEWLDGA